MRASVTVRSPTATTLQALELTNGSELAGLLARGAAVTLAEESSGSPAGLIERLYEKALGRKPTSQELRAAGEIVGQPSQKAGVEDLMWALTMLPEFQLIY